jgi:hypothetical protein
MKKRLLLISLALSLLLTVLLPGVTTARPGDWGFRCPSQSFHAEASVWVTDPGTSAQYGLTIITRGEKAEGIFYAAPGWESMVGATLNVTHNSVIRLNPGTGMFTGWAWAAIMVAFPDNGGRLYGTYSADLTGHFDIIGDQIIIYDVVDDGVFWVSGRDGHSTVSANGSWLGNLEFNGTTLAGTAVVDGQYRSIGR